ncbi:response regulator [Neorhizobium galegae]|uniref:response regulator n=1 Tax=Neorhizobium galegae TaxID=399 RepID=UPI0006210B65|nr:response regulator [Neorhizobium galegae]CDZ30720.1 Response regulator of citrate/malate metabolism [Neorhizobium galegae bv. officinalis]MCQ1769161.1 response regulator [Neorhizobium galegae]MCQ1775712.1 response regulator [Neorhizobium galegae]MCQ1797124.1 response regulator [Neorhizobium galegae]MCQ1846326.1 response regulator [Neorhizobium galegae]
MKVMIVEDEMLLAMELESEVEAAGHEVIGVAMSSHQARDLLSASRPDFAFVDIHLMDGPTGIDVGRRLAEARVPFVFVSGNIKRLPDDFVGALGAIEKPYTVNGMKNALQYISAVLSGVDDLAPPPSLVLAGDIQPPTVRRHA